uniref:C2H2-type domain-containing protein n=1 Tax=Timema poppense TaxID=170557 RepID=A0A7R9GTL8_TIMPO|nr:unnamed protein product [Timema poppensis]
MADSFSQVLSNTKKRKRAVIIMTDYSKEVGYGTEFESESENDGRVSPSGIVEETESCRVPRFTCHVPGCQIDFTSVMDYEVHYNSIHRYLCVECNKCLPSPHLLDLHVAESHDSFFQTLAERKPMYQCYVEACESKFSNTNERRSHCIEIHNYPADFRFDRVPKSKKHKIRKTNKFNKQHGSSADMDMEVAPTVDAPQRQGQFFAAVLVHIIGDDEILECIIPRLPPSPTWNSSSQLLLFSHVIVLNSELKTLADKLNMSNYNTLAKRITSCFTKQRRVSAFKSDQRMSLP